MNDLLNALGSRLTSTAVILSVLGWLIISVLSLKDDVSELRERLAEAQREAPTWFVQRVDRLEARLDDRVSLLEQRLTQDD